MNTFFAEVDKLERALTPEARALQVRARRFLTAFIPALLTSLIAAGPSLTLHVVLSIVFSVAITVLGELDPSVPWSTIVQLLDRARYGEPATSPQAPPRA